MTRRAVASTSRARRVEVTPPIINTHAGVQAALTVLALAALPITAWLFIADYVETRVDVAIARHERVSQTVIERQAEDIDSLQDYIGQLCSITRKIDPSFSCEAQSRFRYRSR